MNEVHFNLAPRTKGGWIDAGRWLAWGALQAAAICLLFGLLFAWLLSLFGVPTVDSTDLSRDTRSNMHLRTDYGTGCQYLESLDGSLTPRMNAGGKQVCATPTQEHQQP